MEDWKYNIDGEEYQIRIRKLTPKECWRLMGFYDEDFEKAKWKKDKICLKGGNFDRQVSFDKALCSETDSDETYISLNAKGNDVDTLKTWADKEVKLSMEISHCDNHDKELAKDVKERKLMGIPYYCICRNCIVLGSTKSYKIVTDDEVNSMARLYIGLALYAMLIRTKTINASLENLTFNGCASIVFNENKPFLKASGVEMNVITERMSNSSLYKQAGNSIVVDCLSAIFKKLM